MSQSAILSARGTPISTQSKTVIKVIVMDQPAGHEMVDNYALGFELNVHDRAEVGRILSTVQRTVLHQLDQIGFFDRVSSASNGKAEPDAVLIGEDA